MQARLLKSMHIPIEKQKESRSSLLHTTSIHALQKHRQTAPHSCHLFPLSSQKRLS